MFRHDTTEGYSQAELDAMNVELLRRLNSDEFDGIEQSERTKLISEDICRRVGNDLRA